jgi:hypothetical protein
MSTSAGRRGAGRRTLILSALTALLIGAQAGATPAPLQPDSEAMMIYNIVRFVSFPGQPHHLRLCAGKTAAMRIQPIDGQPLGRGRVAVIRTDLRFDPATRCDVIYLGAGSPAAITPAHGQILIGDGLAFVKAGGTVGLIPEGSRYRFAINTRSATMAHVHISAQLMRLASRVIG